MSDDVDEAEMLTCPHCGGPMRQGGFALACSGGGRSERIPLPPTCPSKECAQARSEAVMAKAIESGLIDS